MKTLLVVAAVAAIALTSAQAAETQTQNSQSTTVQTDAAGNPVAAQTETRSSKKSSSSLNNANQAAPQANTAVQAPAGSPASANPAQQR